MFSDRRAVRAHLDVELVAAEGEVGAGVVAGLRHGQVRARPASELVAYFLLTDVASEVDLKPRGRQLVVLRLDHSPQVEPVLKVGVGPLPNSIQHVLIDVHPVCEPDSKRQPGRKCRIAQRSGADTAVPLGPPWPRLTRGRRSPSLLRSDRLEQNAAHIRRGQLLDRDKASSGPENHDADGATRHREVLPPKPQDPDDGGSAEGGKPHDCRVERFVLSAGAVAGLSICGGR